MLPATVLPEAVVALAGRASDLDTRDPAGHAHRDRAALVEAHPPRPAVHRDRARGQMHDARRRAALGDGNRVLARARAENVPGGG